MGWSMVKSLRGGWQRGTDCDLWASKINGRLKVIISFSSKFAAANGLQAGGRGAVWIGTLRDRDLLKVGPCDEGEPGFSLRRSGSRVNLVIPAEPLGISREQSRTAVKIGIDRESGAILLTKPGWFPRGE